MRIKGSQAGFTLLEILVVIIIVGVLASVALPTLFRNVERSRATEALTSLGVIKRAIDGCSNGYAGNSTQCNTFSIIGVDDPSASATNVSAHFSYTSPFAGVGAGPTYTLVATRMSLDGGVTTDTITLARNSAGNVTRVGTTAFAGMQ